MTIHVSKDVENAINAAVRSGQFASADEMVAKLVWDYARSHPVQQPAQPVGSGAKPNLGSIGAMRDSADELDEIVADAYRKRREETWRELDL
jgi:Arc/MetJ-type ribon-helix-helix transcriptional regulator